MRAVERSAEPELLAELRVANSEWSDLDGDARRRIRAALRADFGQCCAYCENECQESDGAAANRGTIDHFRPRSRFPDQWLNWLNLVYACRRCNDTKGNLWPETSDAVNQRLSRISRYRPVAEYVNPSAVAGQCAAQEFFAFHFESGRIQAADALESAEWSTAYRTVDDLDLNSDYQVVGDNLPYLRRERLDFFIQRISSMTADMGQTVAVLREFMQPDQPFSSFITAYIADRFPVFKDLL